MCWSCCNARVAVSLATIDFFSASLARKREISMRESGRVRDRDRESERKKYRDRERRTRERERGRGESLKKTKNGGENKKS